MWSLSSSRSLSSLAIPGSSKMDDGQVGGWVIKISRWPQDSLGSQQQEDERRFLEVLANHKGNQDDEMRLKRRERSAGGAGGLDGVGRWSCWEGADRTDHEFRQQRLDPAQSGLAAPSVGLRWDEPWTALSSASQGFSTGGQPPRPIRGRSACLQCPVRI